MRIPSGKTDQLIFFVALDSTDLITRKTGLSSFTVYRSRNGGTATVYTTPTVAELSTANMPGVYALTIDEDTTIASGSDSEEYCVHVTATGMAPVTRTIELYRRDTTSGKTITVDSSGLADANAVKLGPSGSGTAQTARDIGASVLLSSGAGTGQLDFTSGVVKANAVQWLGGTIPAVNVTGVPLVDAKYLLGTAFSTPTVAGIPNVNVKTWNDFATVALPLVPTAAGRTLDVSATGEAGVDWANVGSPTTANALTGTTIASTQKVDVDTIKTNPVVNGGTITFPSTATLASTTNITAGTMTTVTNLTNAATNGDLTTAMKASVNAEADTALADYDAPTHAELTAELATADDAMLAAIAALNNLSAAGVRTELATELARIDAAISSRSTYAGGDTSGVTTLLARLTAIRAGLLDNLDAAISTRLASAGYTAPLDAAGTRSAVGLGSANLDTQLGAIAGYIDTEVAAIVAALVLVKAKTDNLPASPAATGDIPTANQNADAWLDRANAIEAGLTPRQAMRLSLAADAGKLSGGATATNTLRNAVADSKDRMVVSVDADGNRTAITYDLT